MKLNPCYNKEISPVSGQFYFSSFNAFHHRENLHLIRVVYLVAR